MHVISLPCSPYLQQHEMHFMQYWITCFATWQILNKHILFQLGRQITMSNIVYIILRYM